MTTTGKIWRIGALALAMGVIVASGFLLHRGNAKLRVQAAELQRRNEVVVHWSRENRSTREILQRTEADAPDAGQALHADVVRLRAEVRALENHAHAVAAQKTALVSSLAANHDPELGLARLEDFQNVGRGTPGQAVQTLVWAVLKDDAHALAAALSLAPDAREEATELLAHLPKGDGQKYPTPESLAALVFAGEILRVDAMQVVSTTMVDPSHALVGVRLVGEDGEEKVPTELGADDWKVTVPKKMILGLEKRLMASGSLPAK